MMTVASLYCCVAVIDLEPVPAGGCFGWTVRWTFCLTSCCHIRMVQDGNIWNNLASQPHWILRNSSSIPHCMFPSLDIWVCKRGGRLFFSDYFQSVTYLISIDAVNGTIPQMLDTLLIISRCSPSGKDINSVTVSCLAGTYRKPIPVNKNCALIIIIHF